MARHSRADAESTKRAILEAACGILVEDGPEAMTARAVARRAGVSPSLVHHHFIDRDGLVDVVIETMYAKIHALGFELLAAVGRGEPIDLLLERGVRVMFRHAREHRPYTRMLLTTVIRTGELDAARSEQTMTPLLVSASAALAAKIGLDGREVRLRLRSLVLMVSRYAVFNDSELARLVGDSPDPVAVVEDHMVEMARLMLPSR